jgi:glyoxylase-like metal-dependent hydrolase (beta-lactamase superfamily II)
VREASGAWIGLHPDDADLLGSRYVEPSGLLGQMSEILADAGVPEETVNRLASSSMPVRDIVTPAFPDVLFEDGKRVDLNGWDLRAVWTPGHSPGHVCFYSEDHRLLLSGDHILPRITSNIAVHAQQPTNPLAEYFDSLAKVRPLDVEEVLPAHEYRFAGLPARIDEILAHHHDRLGEIEQHLRKVPGATAWEITEQLTWSRTWENMADFVRRAALGEAQAHLVLLETQGRVRLEGRRPVRYYLADDGS